MSSFKNSPENLNRHDHYEQDESHLMNNFTTNNNLPQEMVKEEYSFSNNNFNQEETQNTENSDSEECECNLRKNVGYKSNKMYCCFKQRFNEFLEKNKNSVKFIVSNKLNQKITGNEYLMSKLSNNHAKDSNLTPLP